MRRGILITALALGIACSTESTESNADGTWVGTITTEGDVTTVISESGSVWGGGAQLVEELSIGVDRGEPAYMFGRVVSVWATDARIYVVDRQVPAVRVYDQQGRHLHDIGRPGQGPGEYERPSSVATLPDGRIAVRDYGSGVRIHVFSPEGDVLDTWHGERLYGISSPPVVTYDGDYFTQALGATTQERERRVEMTRVGPEGTEGAVRRFPQLEAPRHPELLAGRAILAIPLWPRVSEAMLPSGAMAAAVANQYRISVDRPDRTRMIIARPIERIPVSAGEWEWHRRKVVATGRSAMPSFTWSGEGLPHVHPVFTAIFADRSRRIWVLRSARMRRVTDCTEDPLDEPAGMAVPCFAREDVADVFDEESGKLLAEVEFPSAVLEVDFSVLFIQGDAVYTAIEDETGTIMVKRYRLVLPERE